MSEAKKRYFKINRIINKMVNKDAKTDFHGKIRAKRNSIFGEKKFKTKKEKTYFREKVLLRLK